MKKKPRRKIKTDHINMDLYNPALNLRFYHCTKNAMTSIIRSLSMEWIDNDKMENYRTFAIIRNPYTRFLSSFLYVMLTRSLLEFNIRDISRRDRERIFSGMPEQIFVKYLTELKKNGIFDTHQVPQIDFFNLEKHGRSIDKIDRFIFFEDIENDIRNLTGISDLILLKENSINPVEKLRYDEFIVKYQDDIKELYYDDIQLYIRLVEERNNAGKEKA